MATTFRTLVNKTGAVYDALKTKVFFAKDYNDHSVAINNLENEVSGFTGTFTDANGKDWDFTNGRLTNQPY